MSRRIAERGGTEGRDTPAHTFVVPAYGVSPYLGTCLDSLLRQGPVARIVVSTSTPGPEVQHICGSRGIELRIHGPNRGIGHDWNFALSQAGGADLVTIAHQDDVYEPEYAACIQAAYRQDPAAGLYFSDSCQIDPDGRRRPVGHVLAVKRILSGAAFMGSRTVTDGWRLRMLLGFGNAIVCPTVTLNLACLGAFEFREDLRTNMDWLAWLDVARRAPLRFVPGRLVGHRVHPGSETSRCIGDGSRCSEDEMVFREFWPAPAAALLARVYGAGYEVSPQ